MKIKLAILFGLALGGAAMAQTNQSATNTLALIGSSDWPVGTRLVIDSNRMVVRDTGSFTAGSVAMRIDEAPILTIRTPAVTNLVAGPVDKIQTLGGTLEHYLTGALGALSAFLYWYGQNRAKIAALVGPLIKSVESHGSPALKAQIEKAAGAAGVEPDMAKAVAMNTSAAPKALPMPQAVWPNNPEALPVLTGNQTPPAPVQPLPPA